MKLAQIKVTVQERHHYFETGATKSLAWRRTQLKALKQLLIDQEHTISEALHNDLSKHSYESYASEIGFVISEVNFALKNLKKWSKKRRVTTPLLAQLGHSHISPEPLGTVLIIGAWNYPIQLVLGPLVAALAAGNCVVLKPSEVAENCSILIADLLPRYLDKQAIAVIQGGIDETTEVLKQRYDHILYTGGEYVAKIVMHAAADNLTPVTLELGGKSPCVIDSNGSLHTTAARLVWSKWMNAGQTCVAPDYVIVERTYADQLIDALKAQLHRFYGDNIFQNSDYGRIINTRHAQRLIAYLKGQNVVIGGEHDLSELYIEPTVVLDPEEDSDLMREEIFGPILPIIRVDHIEQSIAIIQEKPKPLALYLYTQNKVFERQLITATSAGNVSINDGMMFMVNPHLPFGGVGNSGMGKYHGQYGFEAFSHLKAIMKRATLIDPPLRYPPFTKGKLNILKRLMK